MAELAQQHCLTPEQGLQRLSGEMVEEYLAQTKGWSLGDNLIERTFRFKDFYQTIAFVNAVAWIANRQDHHPDLEVGYNRCRVRYTTHAVEGLSVNDFICAARIDALEQ